MRSLDQSLMEHDLLTLRVIGEWWELDLSGVDKQGCVMMLTETLSQVDIQKELLFLPPEEAEAISDLASQGGRIPVGVFSRNHGEIRLMGPGRMEREEPWLDPISAAEALWYRGFLYRAFDETPEGVIEFYFLPKELLAAFPHPEIYAETAADISFQSLKTSPENWRVADTSAVDDLTTLMTIALKLSQDNNGASDFDDLLLNPDPERRSFLLTLANEMALVRLEDGALRPTRAAIGWLKRGRIAQLNSLADAWSHSEWNDLCHIPGLKCEGENWHNDPLLARTALIDALPHTGQWYKLVDLTAFIKETNPDFQRPDGNYDTWYIKDSSGDEYLAGFDAWDRVEGRLIRFLIRGPLYWLGMTELADLGDQPSAAYRLTEQALNWLAGKTPVESEDSNPIIVDGDGSIIVPLTAKRYHRFQVARISEAQPAARGRPFRYQITPRALDEARQQGIQSERLIDFLTQASEKTLPKSVQRAISRWDERGVEGKLESVVVLRVSDEKILETLRNNPRTRDFIGESLGDLAVVVKPGMWEELRAATTQLGLLLETNL